MVTETWAGHVRAVPAYIGTEYERFATNRDVWVSAELTALGAPMLVTCWNSRPWRVEWLDTLVAEMPDLVLQAVRAVSLSVVLPVDTGAFATWTGSEVGAEEDGERVDFQIAELNAWNAIEQLACEVALTQQIVIGGAGFTQADVSWLAATGALLRPAESLHDSMYFGSLVKYATIQPSIVVATNYTESVNFTQGPSITGAPFGTFVGHASQHVMAAADPTPVEPAHAADAMRTQDAQRELSLAA